MCKDQEKIWKAIKIIFEALEQINTQEEYEISEELDELLELLPSDT